MLKQFILLLLLASFLISGCSLAKTEERELGAVIDVVGMRDGTHTDKEFLLNWVFIDERTEEVIAEVNLLELGFRESNYSIEQEKAEQFAKQLALGIDQPLVNPRLLRSGEIKPGQKRVILSESELVEIMMSMKYYNKEIILPIYETYPSVTEEDLSVIKEMLISHYTTYFQSSAEGRPTNIKLSSQAIDHYVVGPNEVFSFNQVVGQRTRERGYQEAPVIINKQLVTGIGGGICQTSSTLYNAVDLAGLEIVERHAHSREVSYVPPNRDATVAWGGPDFKFRNQYDFPILISAYTSVDHGMVEVQIYASSQAEQQIR